MKAHSMFHGDNKVLRRANLLIKTYSNFKSPFNIDYIHSMVGYCYQHLFAKLDLNDNAFDKQYAIIATGALIFAMAYQKHVKKTSVPEYPLSWEHLLQMCQTSDSYFNFADNNVFLEEFIKTLGRKVLEEKSLPFDVNWLDQFSHHQNLGKLKLKERIAAFHPETLSSTMSLEIPLPVYRRTNGRCTIV